MKNFPHILIIIRSSSLDHSSHIQLFIQQMYFHIILYFLENLKYLWTTVPPSGTESFLHVAAALVQSDTWNFAHLHYVQAWDKISGTPPYTADRTILMISYLPHVQSSMNRWIHFPFLRMTSFPRLPPFLNMVFQYNYDSTVFQFYP